ncbi:MAG TPA: hypothetical protein VKR32_04985 [Puia sp.]|nr:hypothetical protein [Puia sp.]
MKNLLTFYYWLFLPLTVQLAFIFSPAFRQYFPVNADLYFLLIYLFIYRPALCGLRLIATHKIGWDKFAHIFIPGWDSEYFGFLFFNRG